MGHQQARILQATAVDEAVSICTHDPNNTPVAGWCTAGPDKDYQRKRRADARCGGFSPLLQVDRFTASGLDNRCRSTNTLEAVCAKNSDRRGRADRKLLHSSR